MEKYILLCAGIILCVSAVFSGIRQLQMLQQSSYFPSRYFGWIKKSFVIPLVLLAFVFCLAAVLLQKKLYIILLCGFAVLLAIRVILCIKTHKKSIKKLVFTARVKRLISAEILILACLLVLFELFEGRLAGEISGVILLCVSLISPLLCLAAWALTLPLEKIFTAYYINDAKRILRQNPGLKVIGITGSYGKTTTKFILNRILSERYNTVCTPQSFNTPMGVVRTVRASIKPSTQIFICEMGAKKCGDIKEICDIANPESAIITSVGLQHLDTFKTKENIFKTKFELADCVRKNGGRTFINLDSEAIAENVDRADPSFVFYGSDSALSCYADNVTYSADGSSFDLHLFGEKINVTTRLLGAHAVCNILAAASIAYSLGVSADEIRFAVFSLKPTEHRLQLKPFYTGTGLMIDDAYNANPEGSLAAVKVLGSFGGMQKIIITPGLIELGSKEYEANYNLGLEAAKYCDKIILVGENRSKPLADAILTTDFNKENLFIAKSFKEALSICIPFTDKNTVVLLENDLPDNYLN